MSSQNSEGMPGRRTIIVCSPAAELPVFIRHVLEREGLDVDLASDAIEGFDLIIGQKTDAVLIDAELAGSLHLCRRLERLDPLERPRVVVLFGQSTIALYPAFLAAGMDRGLVRPVDPAAVLDALGSSARQDTKPGSGLIVWRDLKIDLPARRVFRSGKAILLTRLEFELLKCLVGKAMTVLTRAELIAAAWPKGVFVDPRTVNIHIGRLRRRLMAGGGEDLIRTVRGEGYSLDGTGRPATEDKSGDGV